MYSTSLNDRTKADTPTHYGSNHLTQCRKSLCLTKFDEMFGWFWKFVTFIGKFHHRTCCDIFWWKNESNQRILLGTLPPYLLLNSDLDKFKLFQFIKKKGQVNGGGWYQGLGLTQ